MRTLCLLMFVCISEKAEFLNVSFYPPFENDSDMEQNKSSFLVLSNSSITVTSVNTITKTKYNKELTTVLTNVVNASGREVKPTLTKDMKSPIAYYNNLEYRIWQVVSPILLGKCLSLN